MELTWYYDNAGKLIGYVNSLNYNLCLLINWRFGNRQFLCKDLSTQRRCKLKKVKYRQKVAIFRQTAAATLQQRALWVLKIISPISFPKTDFQA